MHRFTWVCSMRWRTPPSTCPSKTRPGRCGEMIELALGAVCGLCVVYLCGLLLPSLTGWKSKCDTRLFASWKKRVEENNHVENEPSCYSYFCVPPVFPDHGVDLNSVIFFMFRKVAHWPHVRLSVCWEILAAALGAAYLPGAWWLKEAVRTFLSSLGTCSARCVPHSCRMPWRGGQNFSLSSFSSNFGRVSQFV